MVIKEKAKTLLSLTDLVKSMNKAWHDTGQVGMLSIKGDDIEVTESEVKLKFHCVMTVTVSKDSIDLGSLEAVKPSVSQSSSNK
jgi:hypothetical protein